MWKKVQRWGGTFKNIRHMCHVKEKLIKNKVKMKKNEVINKRHPKKVAAKGK